MYGPSPAITACTFAVVVALLVAAGVILSEYGIAAWAAGLWRRLTHRKEKESKWRP